MSNILKSFLLTLTATGLAACNYTVKSGNNEILTYGVLNENEKLTLMNYEYISTRIISPRCTSCHGISGHVNLETYENVIANIKEIQKTVFLEQSMPKMGTLSNYEKKILSNWISLGAPKISLAPPPANPDPLSPTFGSISRNIFEIKCISCHNSAGTGKRILLDKQSLLDSPLELIIPQNPDESGLVVSIERHDDKRMPPAKEGFTDLKFEEKAAIRIWIANGAKD